MSAVISFENHHMANGGDVPVILDYDDHLKHIEGHYDFICSMMLTSQINHIFKQHIQEHQKALLKVGQIQPVLMAPLPRSDTAPSGTYWYHIDRVHNRIDLENHDGDPNWDNPRKNWDWFKMHNSGYLEGTNNYKITFHPDPSGLVSQGLQGVLNNTGNSLFGISATTYNKWKSTNCWQKDVKCCSDVKNLGSYVNFYDKKIKYCKCCGNEVK